MREVSLKRAEFAELAAAILDQGGFLCFKAHGSSMSPFIQDGDRLTVQPVRAADLRVGDVVFYRASGGRLVAHRVVGRRVQSSRVVLATRGDASSGPDEWVQARQVLGRIMSVQRGRKIAHLDGGSWRLAALLWVRLSPLSPLLLRLVGVIKRTVPWFLHRLQVLTLYRVLAEILLGKKNRIPGPQDALQ